MPVNANISSAIDIRLPATPEQVDDIKAFKEFQIVYAAIRSLHAALSGVNPDGTIPTLHNSLSGINLDDIQHLSIAEVAKLLGIEAGAQVNNITDIDALDLTDGGETILHKHDFDHVTFPATNVIGSISHVYTLSELMDHEWSAGIVHDCALTDNGNGTVSIASGTATIRADTNPHSTLFGIDTVEQLNIALTDNSMNYLYLNYAGASTAFAVTTSPSIPNGLNKILAYEIHRLGNVIHWVDQRFQQSTRLEKPQNYMAEYSSLVMTKAELF